MIILDNIIIKNLEIFCNHGVLKEENVLGQKFLISARLFVDIRPAGLSDSLELSVNYADVCHTVKTFLEHNTYKLIETAAEKTAQELLIKYPLIKTVDLEIKKPWAPILLPLEYVSVSVTRSRHTAYLSIGSNIGDKKRYLEQAVQKLDKHALCSVTKVSDFIDTKPFGPVKQDDFLNACLEVETLLTPHELLDVCHIIEQDAGRERKVKWGPRTLDIDIVFYDDCIISDPTLTIPHIYMTMREFVLKPLAQIAPYKLHPVNHLTVAQLYMQLEEETNK